MKKILIVNNNLRLGGVQKALVNLLRELAQDPSLQITLLLFYPHGALLNRLPPSVRVITPTAPWRCWGLTRADAAPLRDRLLRTFFAGCTRLFGREKALRMAYPFQKPLRGYDVAISYLHSGSQKMFYGGCCEFVLRCVEAPKKIAFLHCDYGSINADCPENTALYNAFDAVAACSEGCRDAFLRVLPQMAARTAVVPNCQDYEGLAAYRDDAPKHVHTPLRLITVARFGREKGVLRAIRALGALGERAEELRYDVIGDGIEFTEARALVKALGLERVVTLHGEIPEPYAQMCASDVLLIPSVSEAAPLVIGEAAALGVPTLTTETSSAREMVGQTGLGWVCENSEDGIRRGIGRLLDHPEDIEEKQAVLRNLSAENRTAVERLMELMN